MKHEAKFSVILPAGNYASAQIEAFEQLAIHYNLPVRLPLSADRAGNLVVATSMSLRDAQLLRRQISSLGFMADCVSDASESQLLNKDGGVDTLVVDTLDIPEPPSDSVTDMTMDAWESVEMPQLDLGLSDAADISATGRWNESNWLEPDESAIPEETPTKESTLGMSAKELFSAAMAASNEGNQSNQSLNAVSILGGNNQFAAQANNTATQKDNLLPPSTFFEQKSVLSESPKKKTAPNTNAQPTIAAKMSETTDMPIPQELIDSTNATAAVPQPQNFAPAQETRPVPIQTKEVAPAAAVPANHASGQVSKVSNEYPADAQSSKKKKIPATVILAWLLIFIVVICLVMAVFYAYIEPKEVLVPLLKPVL